MSNSFDIPWTVGHKAFLSMKFPRQKYWSGLPFPFPGDLPDTGIKPGSSVVAGRFFTTGSPRKPQTHGSYIINVVRDNIVVNNSIVKYPVSKAACMVYTKGSVM